MIVRANALAGRPSCIPAPRRVSGAKGRGLAYERAIAKRLPFAAHGPWYEFWEGDSKRRRYCQPDFVFEAPLGQIVILEAKYTWTIEAHEQLARYREVVALASGKPACGLVICKRLLDDIFMPSAHVFGDLWDAIASARSGRQAVFQWLGKGQIFSPRMLDLTHTPRAA